MFVRTPIRGGQVDLVTGYTKLLSDPATQRRFYVMLEATRVLGDDAFPVLVARLTDPKEPVETKLEYLARCATMAHRRSRSAGARASSCVPLRRRNPPATAALAALACCRPGPEASKAALRISLSEARPLLTALLRALGEIPNTQDFLNYTTELYLWAGSPLRNDPTDKKEVKQAVVAALVACKSAIRRQYLAFLFDAPLSDVDRRALAQLPSLGSQAARHQEITPRSARERRSQRARAPCGGLALSLRALACMRLPV